MVDWSSSFATWESRGEERFLPVRSDATRILTCFLEYQADRVTVHDLLHVHEDEGWRVHVGSYPKLRLDQASVLGDLETAGFSVEESTNRQGLITIVARWR